MWWGRKSNPLSFSSLGQGTPEHKGRDHCLCDANIGWDASWSLHRPSKIGQGSEYPLTPLTVLLRKDREASGL